jgi:uncharacterized protein (UPF0303 family)
LEKVAFAQRMPDEVPFCLISRHAERGEPGFMSLETDIARLKLQEERLAFTSFNEEEAWKLGSAMRAHALERKLPIVMDIRIGIRPLFYAALPGTTPENPDWVRRKVNTVYRFAASSYRVVLEYKLKGDAFDASRGIDLMNYAPAGGGFPIRLAGNVVGVVTISGIPQREDHNFAVESLSLHLGVPYSEIALPPENS